MSMMSMFFDDLRSSFFNDSVGDFSAVVSERAAYITGVRGVKSFSAGEVEVYVKKGTVSVKGEKLEIKKICRGDAVICGKIVSVSKI